MKRKQQQQSITLELTREYNPETKQYYIRIKKQ